MSFVEQEDILNIFEGLTRHLLKEVKEVDLNTFPRMTYDEAMRLSRTSIPKWWLLCLAIGYFVWAIAVFVYLFT